MNPPPLPGSEQNRDREHLKLLAVFHFVVAGFALCGTAFLFVHYFMMSAFFSNPQMWTGPNGPAGPPPEFFAVFKWIYFLAGLVMMTALACNVLSGIFLLKRQHRLFSLVIAGLNCLQVPFGTALGVFTFVVLLRESVRDAYAAADA